MENWEIRRINRILMMLMLMMAMVLVLVEFFSLKVGGLVVKEVIHLVEDYLRVEMHELRPYLFKFFFFFF